MHSRYLISYRPLLQTAVSYDFLLSTSDDDVLQSLQLTSSPMHVIVDNLRRIYTVDAYSYILHSSSWHIDTVDPDV